MLTPENKPLSFRIFTLQVHPLSNLYSSYKWHTCAHYVQFYTFLPPKQIYNVPVLSLGPNIYIHLNRGKKTTYDLS